MFFINKSYSVNEYFIIFRIDSDIASFCYFTVYHKLAFKGKLFGLTSGCNILSAQYGYCDLDTRSIITIVILNSVTEEDHKEALRENMSAELVKAWKAAEKYRGKKVKPAKKKKQSFLQKMADQSIENRNAYYEQMKR